MFTDIWHTPKELDFAVELALFGKEIKQVFAEAELVNYLPKLTPKDRKSCENCSALTCCASPMMTNRDGHYPP